MSDAPDPYVHGHHSSVIRSHTWRNAENSAPHLLPHLSPGMSVLDIGCGPGTITVDLARRVAPGPVTGLAAVSAMVEQADAALESTDVTNCSFRTGDVYNLYFDDDSFDVVHAHQVLQHLTDPVAALSEMARVAKPGGIIAVRDADYAGMTWAPPDPLLDRWLELYHQITEKNAVEADAGRYLLGWVQQVDVDSVTATSSTWTFATPSLRAWWGGLWADRVRESSYADHALSHQLSDRAELDAIAHAWQRWAEHPDGFFVVPHGEVIAVVA